MKAIKDLHFSTIDLGNKLSLSFFNTYPLFPPHRQAVPGQVVLVPALPHM